MNQIQGAAFPCNYDDGEEARMIYSIVAHDARKSLPKGTVFEIRASEYPRDGGTYFDFGRIHKSRQEMAKDWGIAWIAPVEQEQELFERDPFNGVERDGYVLLARMKA